MRPYLAVLKDSFREALASRVLWIVIILTTLALVVVAPLGIKEETAARLRRNSVRNWPATGVPLSLCREAGLPRIRLHDTRGTMNGILEQAGVADSLHAAWLGHTVVVNRKNYLPKPRDLTPVSDTIGRPFRGPGGKTVTKPGPAQRSEDRR